MHGNQWVLKIAVLKYYSVSKRGTTAKSNPKQATDPISLHTKFGDNSSNTFPLNERKPCVTPDIGRRTPDAGHRTSDIGHRTSDGEKSKNNISTPQGGGHNKQIQTSLRIFIQKHLVMKHFLLSCTVLVRETIKNFHYKQFFCSRLCIPALKIFTFEKQRLLI